MKTVLFLVALVSATPAHAAFVLAHHARHHASHAPFCNHARNCGSPSPITVIIDSRYAKQAAIDARYAMRQTYLAAR